MRRFISLLAGAAVFASALSGVAMAQGIVQSLTHIDKSATGHRTSKIVGSKVVNVANETVGAVDDLIVTAHDKVPFAVLSVGGFLGMGKTYVVVPYAELEARDDHMLYRGATKASVKNLPEFKYQE